MTKYMLTRLFAVSPSGSKVPGGLELASGMEWGRPVGSAGREDVVMGVGAVSWFGLSLGESSSSSWPREEVDLRGMVMGTGTGTVVCWACNSIVEWESSPGTAMSRYCTTGLC